MEQEHKTPDSNQPEAVFDYIGLMAKTSNELEEQPEYIRVTDHLSEEQVERFKDRFRGVMGVQNLAIHPNHYAELMRVDEEVEESTSRLRQLLFHMCLLVALSVIGIGSVYFTSTVTMFDSYVTDNEFYIIYGIGAAFMVAIFVYGMWAIKRYKPK